MTAPTTPGTSAVPPAEAPPVPGPLRPATPIDQATFRESLDFVLPRAEDMKWASIPWQTDLWEARRLAGEQGKPIFMWAMNGNPLGCV